MRDPLIHYPTGLGYRYEATVLISFFCKDIMHEIGNKTLRNKDNRQFGVMDAIRKILCILMHTNKNKQLIPMNTYLHIKIMEHENNLDYSHFFYKV